MRVMRSIFCGVEARSAENVGPNVPSRVHHRSAGVLAFPTPSRSGCAQRV